MRHCQALIVGAGPTGLTAAIELTSAGVDVVIVDKQRQSSAQSRAGWIQPRIADVLDQRRLLRPILDGARFDPTTIAHFAGIPVDLSAWIDRQPAWPVPQSYIERTLERHLRDSGIGVQRGTLLTALTQNDTHVDAEIHDGRPDLIRADYVVAADGAHSTIRTLVGVDFPGRAGDATGIIADLRLHTAELLPQFMRSSTGRWALSFPLGDELQRVVIAGGEASLARKHVVTNDEISAALGEIYPFPVEVTDLRYATRIDNAARQIAHYRHHRVLFAGDAAHIHLPMGGQGMNLGIGDAHNLGWKLAATIHATAAPTLLDTYHAERHPVAAAVLANTRVQGVLLDWTSTPQHDIDALRGAFTALATTGDGQHHLAGILSGQHASYGPAQAHPVGRPAPDLALTHNAGRLHDHLDAGRGLLLTTDLTVTQCAQPWTGRIDHLAAAPTPSRSTAHPPHVLVRPDGYIAWAGDHTRNLDMLRDALHRWFGPPPQHDHQHPPS